jgi:hypothetical protein
MIRIDPRCLLQARPRSAPGPSCSEAAQVPANLVILDIVATGAAGAADAMAEAETRANRYYRV